MSKEHITPEVGDVWQYRYGLDKVHILSILSDRIRCVLLIDKRFVQQREYLTERFLEDYRYLGKSKANIDDLFKTENEE